MVSWPGGLQILYLRARRSCSSWRCSPQPFGRTAPGATAGDADVDSRTADRTIGLLEDPLVIARVPAWHSKALPISSLWRINREG